MGDRAQIDTALRFANQLRMEKAGLRARVRPLPHEPGRHELAAVLQEHPRALRNAAIVDVLRWVKRMQPWTVARILRVAGCSESRLYGELTGRQVDVIAGLLRLSPAELALADDGFVWTEAA